jgi:hypothetical protein
MLFQGDYVVAATTIDYYGVFEFLEVPAGSYGLVAAGVDGVGMIAINVRPDNTGGANAGDASIVDFTMIPSETVGWLNNYASEVAYHRALLAPRPRTNDKPPYGCPQCGNQPGGCAACQAAYLASNCASRGISFEQWALTGCLCDARKFGDGAATADVVANLRKNFKRVDKVVDRVFYSGSGQYGSSTNNYQLNTNGSAYGNQSNYGYGPNDQPLYGSGN